MTPAAPAVGIEPAVGSATEAPSRAGLAQSRGIRGLWPLGSYVVLSLLLFGVPVLGHFASRIVASDQLDSSQFMWFFAWWPHALLHGLNPFVTHAMFVPQGYNLTWATAMPGPSLLLSPVTLAFGPAATWNVIQLCSPALSAWTMFLLCRQLRCPTWPSLAAGYVFGFSPYMLVHLTGGPYLALVALLPLLVLLVLRWLEGSISGRRFMVWMTLALTAQYSISSEVLTTATLFGAIALALAFALLPERRTALAGVVRLLVGAYAVTAILISPFLYYFLAGHHYPPGKTFFAADLASFALPGTNVAIDKLHGGVAYLGGGGESYLGVPLLVLVGLYAWRCRRERAAQLLTACFAVAVLASLGVRLLVRGHKTAIPLPWDVLAHVPGLRYVIPVRLAVYALLPAAVIVGLWLRGGGVARWALALLAIAFIVPDVGSALWDTPIKDPGFFSSGEYRSYLKPSDNVLTVPAWGPNQRWQADTGFRFNLSDGYAGNPFPASYTRYPTYQTLLTERLTPGYAAQLRRFLAAKRVTAIVVQDGVPGPWPTLFRSLGIRPIQTGGVAFYRLRNSS